MEIHVSINISQKTPGAQVFEGRSQNNVIYNEQIHTRSNIIYIYIYILAVVAYLIFGSIKIMK